jgi:hypothetical protein
VIAPTCGDEPLLHERLELQLAFLRSDEVEAEVRLSARHRGEHFVGARIEHLHPHLRAALVVAADHVREVVVHRRRHAGHGHLAHASDGDPADAEQRGVEIVEELADLALEVAADRGERHAARRSLEQPHRRAPARACRCGG